MNTTPARFPMPAIAMLTALILASVYISHEFIAVIAAYATLGAFLAGAEDRKTAKKNRAT